MKWVPKWIGSIYCKLWAEKEERIFSFEDAKKLCGKYTLNYLSELKKAQLLFVFEKKGRKRAYRLVSPNVYVFSLAHNLDLSWLKQGAYANLLLKIYLALNKEYSSNLQSLGVFGSVARNNARNDSDLDLFLVFKEIQGTIGERLDELSKIEEKNVVKNEIEFLKKNKYFPRISFYPRSKPELKMSFFTIDISFDIKILYDTNILLNFLEKINKKIQECNIKRKYLDDTRYYLDLNLKFGDIFEFE